uniref:Uncharacterized protein n=1 Tax=Arundo donax TaxID=35708 RepID=A0A0A9AV38_ARUDO
MDRGRRVTASRRRGGRWAWTSSGPCRMVGSSRRGVRSRAEVDSEATTGKPRAAHPRPSSPHPATPPGREDDPGSSRPYHDAPRQCPRPKPPTADAAMSSMHGGGGSMLFSNLGSMLSFHDKTPLDWDEEENVVVLGRGDVENSEEDLRVLLLDAQGLSSMTGGEMVASTIGIGGGWQLAWKYTDGPQSGVKRMYLHDVSGSLLSPPWMGALRRRQRREHQIGGMELFAFFLSWLKRDFSMPPVCNL